MWLRAKKHKKDHSSETLDIVKLIETMTLKTYLSRPLTVIYLHKIMKMPLHATKDASNVKHQKKTELHIIEMLQKPLKKLIQIDMLHILRRPSTYIP